MKLLIFPIVLKIDMAECCKRHEKGEKDCGYRFMQSSKVKGKVCQILPHDIPMLCGNNLLEAINS